AAVDRLRAAGHKVGLLRPRLFRPFPADTFRRLLAPVRGVAVIDQNLSIGSGGVLHSELAGALYGQPGAPMLVSFVGGLGGRDIGDDEFAEILRTVATACDSGVPPPPRLMFTDTELREVRKMQAVAHVEREDLEATP
ncbi:MAG: pyruvate synthase, partial [Alphaproteobacteria bacterium]|nr:pyruvate synthase [Alphaproteobacteria bacterium]